MMLLYLISYVRTQYKLCTYACALQQITKECIANLHEVQVTNNNRINEQLSECTYVHKLCARH